MLRLRSLVVFAGCVILMLSGCREAERGAASGKGENSAAEFLLRLRTATIDDFELTNASVDEAFEVLDGKWKAAFGESSSLPVAKLNFGDFEVEREHGLISLDLEDVPFEEAVRYIADLSGLRYRVHQLGMISLEPVFDVGSDVRFRRYSLSADAIAFFEFEENDSGADDRIGHFAPEEVKEGAYPVAGLLRRYDFRMSSAAYLPASSDAEASLMISAEPVDLQRMSGILHLIDSGFTLKAPTD